MKPAIEISALGKSYGNLRALEDVNISVNEGELFGLIGPDGAGKSTIYRILTTLILPDEGRARIKEFDVVKEYRDVRKIVGYMPERFSLYQDLTVMENLQFYASLFGVSVKENYPIIAAVFEPQLSHFPNRPAGALSGGMKQKLALSCALIHKPEVLLLDEPTTGVDAISRAEFWEMLHALKREGITILVSTSYMDEAQLCDRIALINHGRIMKTDTPRHLIEGLDERLYNAESSRMYPLLSRLRAMPEVERAYTFGSTLHVVAGAGFNAGEAENILHEEGLHDAEIYPAKGDIEDLFIKLAGDGESEK